MLTAIFVAYVGDEIVHLVVLSFCITMRRLVSIWTFAKEEPRIIRVHRYGSTRDTS